LISADLKRFALLAEFTEEDREELLEQLEPMSVPAGRPLCREGEEADALYLIREGRLRISSKSRGEIGEIASGASIGAASLVVVGLRPVSITALKDVDLLVLTRESFRRLAEDAPRTACRMAEAIVADIAGILRPSLERIG
jgi:CRP-like cAMP-binding protein